MGPAIDNCPSLPGEKLGKDGAAGLVALGKTALSFQRCFFGGSLPWEEYGTFQRDGRLVAIYADNAATVLG